MNSIKTNKGVFALSDLKSQIEQAEINKGCATISIPLDITKGLIEEIDRLNHEIKARDAQYEVLATQLDLADYIISQTYKPTTEKTEVQTPQAELVELINSILGQIVKPTAEGPKVEKSKAEEPAAKKAKAKPYVLTALTLSVRGDVNLQKYEWVRANGPFLELRASSPGELEEVTQYMVGKGCYISTNL